MKIEGHTGICACCFGPIEEGEEVGFRDGGRKFHRRCVEKNPENYYVKLERRAAKRAVKRSNES